MSAHESNVYLIGPMGSGKTTIGQRVARKLGMDFYDCDKELEARTGASVSLIFDVEGESGFRERESRILAELAAKNNVLVSTGGGVVLSEENRRLLKQTGIVVYLQTSVNQQLSRLYRDKSRPLLQSGNREKKLTELAAARNPIYEALADLVFPSQNRSLAASAERLGKAIVAYRENARDPAGSTQESP